MPDIYSLDSKSKKEIVAAQEFLQPRLDEVMRADGGISLQLTFDPRTPGLEGIVRNVGGFVFLQKNPVTGELMRDAGQNIQNQIRSLLKELV